MTNKPCPAPYSLQWRYVRQRTETGETGWEYSVPDHSPPEASMNLHLSIGPLVSLVAGILILVVPRLLSYIVAFYLIVIGLLGLFGSGALQ